MAKQIHESILRRNTFMLFSILIHKLCVEARVRVSLHLDAYMEALHTMYHSLIKADENSVALQRATPSPIPQPFAFEPSTEGFDSSCNYHYSSCTRAACNS